MTGADIGFEALFHTLPNAALVIAPDDGFGPINAAAEQFFGLSARALRTRGLRELAPEGSRLAEVIAQARGGAISVSEYGMELETHESPPRLVDVQAAAIHELPGAVLLLVHPRAIAERIDRSLAHRGAARSLTGLSAALAHEVKNPLAGISGAAQLIEMNAGEGDAELARLIQEETRRIERLIDRMEAFADAPPSALSPVNLHSVLSQVRMSAEAGFARTLRIAEDYDPSLPPTPGDRDRLIQALLNLVKNAAEAAGAGGAITLRTAYRSGVRLSTPGRRARESLPLEVCVIDDGPGVPPALMEHIFEPFVTSRSAGGGLGLAITSKIIADHGGVVECESRPGRTVFRILLPVFVEKREGAE